MTDLPGRLAPSTIRFAPAQVLDSTGVCEGGLTPIGIVLPEGTSTTVDCPTPLWLRHMWNDAEPGSYVFLDLPACPESWCRSLQTSDKIRCEILIGNPCCLLESLGGKELSAIAGTRVGPITDALQGRFDADTDRRAVCYSQYQGNQARVVRVLIVKPSSTRGRDTYRVLEVGHLFLRQRQDKSDDILGELVPRPPRP